MLKIICYRLCELLHKGFNKICIVPGLKKSFGDCGENVRVSYDCDIKPAKNVYIGNNSQIGPHSLLWTTMAKIRIGNNVLMGPHVTIISGDHRTDIIGKHIIEVSDEEKLPEHDEDVIIEDGVWISANVTILKGVTIGEGAVVAAGALVTRNVEPYTVFAGVPAKKIKDRFTEDEIIKHKSKITERI